MYTKVYKSSDSLSLLRGHGVSFHFYADDTQIYLPIKRNDLSDLTSLLLCLDEVKSRLAQNVLSLNEDKTEVIVFGPTDNFQTSSIDLKSLSAFRFMHLQNLGVLLDEPLKLDKQISSNWI